MNTTCKHLKLEQEDNHCIHPQKDELMKAFNEVMIKETINDICPFVNNGTLCPFARASRFETLAGLKDGEAAPSLECWTKNMNDKRIIKFEVGDTVQLLDKTYKICAKNGNNYDLSLIGGTTNLKAVSEESLILLS